MSEKIFKDIWTEALRQIQEEYNSTGQGNVFNIYKIDYLEDTMSEIKVSVASDFMWNMMKTNGYIKNIEDKIESICGQKVTLTYESVKKENPASASSTSGNYSKSFKPSFEFTASPEPVDDRKTVPIQSKSDPLEETENPTKVHPELNEDLTFERFVSGENTEFAYSASLAASKEPGKKFNPLLIYGGVGLGKTHLMQAIGNYIFKNPPEGKQNPQISYKNLESFTNEFTKSIRDQTMDKFIKKYRNLDVLLIDDIQFLENKVGLQEELFHTFEALSQKKAQMVFTCDKPLSELKGIEERLISRFAQGTAIDLQAPNYETRKAILQKKIQEKGKEVPDEIIDFIAKSVQSNVRELEGCLNKLLGYAELLGKPLSMDIARKQLSDNISSASDGIISIDTIQKVVSDYYNITVEDIKGKKKTKNLAFARAIAVYLSRTLTSYTLKEISMEFGGRDHTTIMHSIDTITDSLKTDSTMISTIEILTRDIKDYKKM